VGYYNIKWYTNDIRNEESQRADANRMHELDAGLMDAAKPMSSGSSVRKCPHCVGTLPMQASFCGDCGSKI